MARWSPLATVGKKEPVGRRLFDEPLFAGATQSFAGLSLNHFLERRGEELSLDRLGRTNIEKQVVAYVSMRAVAHGKTFHPPKRFDGWAWIRVEHLETPVYGATMPVIASPILVAGLAENVYHAHVDLSAWPDPYSAALHLRHIFTTLGAVERWQAADHQEAT